MVRKVLRRVETLWEVRQRVSNLVNINNSAISCAFIRIEENGNVYYKLVFSGDADSKDKVFKVLNLSVQQIHDLYDAVQNEVSEIRSEERAKNAQT